MPSGSSAEELSQRANFVFQGRVKKLKAASMPSVKITDKTAIVTVDQILHGPELLSGYAGKDITVQLSGSQKVKVGQEAIFFTNPTSYGEGIEVESLGHHLVKSATMLRGAGGATSDPVQNLADRDIKARFDDSDLVISGRVTSVSLPTQSDEDQGSFSEHNPLWRDAVIEVEAVHKGSYSGKTIVVRFPSSEDIKWNDSPKFHVGQEGLFMLSKEKIRSRTVGHQARSTEAYTALSPFDFQASNEEGGIKRLIGPAIG